jgi:hypothetical protein
VPLTPWILGADFWVPGGLGVVLLVVGLPSGAGGPLHRRPVRLGPHRVVGRRLRLDAAVVGYLSYARFFAYRFIVNNG